jgi:predicted ATP-grasp superfamily ATP-dependent carboligase
MALPSIGARILAMSTDSLLMFDDQLRCSRWLLRHMPRHSCHLYDQPRAESVVKSRFSMGSAGVVLLPTAAECSAYVARQEYDPELHVVQELLPRVDGGAEWKVLVLADAGVLLWRSHMRFMTTQPALLYTPDVTILRAHEVELPADVARLADDFVRTARWTGVAVLDIMLREGAPPVLIEVNPRFSVAFAQSSASAASMLKLYVNHSIAEVDSKERTWTWPKWSLM